VISQVQEALVDEMGLPVYARLVGQGERYLLVGATPAEVDAIAAAGLLARLLDEDIAGRAYYLVYSPADGFCPEWSAYADLLLADQHFALLRVAPGQADRLAEAGFTLRRVTLDPKPLRSARGGHIASVTVTPDPTVQVMIDQVYSSTLTSYTGGLSGEHEVEIGGGPYTILTRHTASGEPIEKATQYVAEHLTGLGLDVGYHDWSYGGYTNRNVVGELRGESNPDHIFVICAHLDDMPSGFVAPGADDNASGSVAVLVAADIMSQYRWDCSLRFALWTGEEQGLLGSHVYAMQAAAIDENIAGVLNFDMIAWDSTGGPDIDLYSDPALTETYALSQLFADVVSVYDLDLTPQLLDTGMGASDHASFWDYGYPAILGIEDHSDGDFNPYYHSPSDRLEYLNMPYYTEFVRAAVAAFAHLSGCRIAGGDGALRGHVEEATGGTAVEGAQVVAYDQTNHIYTTTTDPWGYYTLLLPPGTYRVTASAPGYLPTVYAIALESGRAGVANFSLGPLRDQHYLPFISRVAPVAPSR
jgi:hypothetical protein